MRGSRCYPAFVAVVEGIRMASALFLLLFHHNGAFVESGMVTLLIGAFALLALYHEKADEYFEATGLRVARPVTRCVLSASGARLVRALIPRR